MGIGGTVNSVPRPMAAITWKPELSARVVSLPQRPRRPTPTAANIQPSQISQTYLLVHSTPSAAMPVKPMSTAKKEIMEMADGRGPLRKTDWKNRGMY